MNAGNAVNAVIATKRVAVGDTSLKIAGPERTTEWSTKDAPDSPLCRGPPTV